MGKHHDPGIGGEAQQHCQDLCHCQADIAAEMEHLRPPGQVELQDVGSEDGGQDVLDHGQCSQRRDQHHEMSRSATFETQNALYFFVLTVS